VARSVSFAPRVEFDQTLEEAFPIVDHNLEPYGSRVLVQMRTAKKLTKGGIALPTETQDTQTWNNQVGVVRAIGPTAFKDQKTLEPWPEGVWCKVGDYVRIPKHNADKFEIRIPGRGPDDGDVALFTLVDHLYLLGRVPKPLADVAFV
jgi:co-chaperonin GroES (HSP10)